MAIDPVCGTHINEELAVPDEQFTSEYDGETYYFCSGDCKEAFDGDPDQYLRETA